MDPKKALGACSRLGWFAMVVGPHPVHAGTALCRSLSSCASVRSLLGHGVLCVLVL